MKALVRVPAPASRGDIVEVREQNIRPWRGVVGAVKFSPVSGWWCEVREERGIYVVAGELVRVVPG